MAAVFEQNYVKRITGENVKTGKNKMELAEQLIEDIAKFKSENNCSRLVMVWAASTEIYIEESEVHNSIEAFEKAMYDNDPAIAPSMIYAYAAIKSGVPFANGAPNLTVDIPALTELAEQTNVPICGKDFKTGQTLMKTILAPGLKSRMLGLDGWYSTNILGNRDGEVLDDPENFKTKEDSKLSVLEHIFQPDVYPDLYGDFSHVVRINYYPPRGDNKEGWDNIDIFGWLGYKMQIKIDFLCRDSILAAPLALDLALFHGPCSACRNEGHSGMAVVLLQSTADCSGTVPRARSLHPVNEAQKHPSPHEGRGIDHASRALNITIKSLQRIAQSHDPRKKFMHITSFPVAPASGYVLNI